MAALVEGAARRLSREEAEERATRAREPLCGALVGVAVGALVGAGVGVDSGTSDTVGAGVGVATGAEGRATMPSRRRR